MQCNFQNPTQLIFGAGSLEQLGTVAAQYGKKALLVTGGGSVKRNGTYDRAVASLNAAGVAVVDCSGVEPNPRITTVDRGAKLAKAEGCDLIIALGGGSTMDASKVIAAAYYYDGDPWNIIYHGQPEPYFPVKALPVITVPTLAATGSEMNMGAVISNEATKEKSFVQAPCLYPKVALVDPELTLTVPQNQIANGVCDLITHITETYFNSMDNTPIQDRFAEGTILTAMEYGKKALADKNDLEARAQIQWASIVALNGWMSAGVVSFGFPVHMIEHTLSAHHDITHAAGLAAINPSWMRFAAKHRPNKFVQFAERIFGLKPKNETDLECALEGIDRFEAFLKEIGCPTSLTELKIDDKLFETYADDTLKIINDGKGNLPALPPMSKQDIVDMLKAAL